MRKLVLLLALVTCSIMVFAQTRTITGTVKDESGNAVPFATVTEKGTSNAVSADDQGNFRISAKAGAALEISSTGFQMVTQNATSTPMSIVLAVSKEQTISEVVVTALGIKRQNRALGYSAQTVDASKLENARATNVVDALAG